MANNSSNCPPASPWVQETAANAKYFTYQILVYPYFVFGVIGHTIFFAACYTKAKKEPSFLYQSFTSANRLLEIVSFTLLTFAFNRWAGLIMKGAPWFQRSFICMWYAAHLCIPIVNGFINTSLFLTLCVVVDRLIAIDAPHTHRKWCRGKKHKVLAMCSCLLVGFGIMAHDTRRFYLSYDEGSGLYFLHDNIDYLNNATSRALTTLRISILILGVTALWACNIAVIRVHRSKMVHVVHAAVAVTPMTAAEAARLEKRKEVERTLLLLMLCQGTVNGVAIGSFAAWYMSFYFAPDWLRCTGIVMMLAPIGDAGLQIAALLDFYMPLILSKSVRQMVLQKSDRQNPQRKVVATRAVSMITRRFY